MPKTFEDEFMEAQADMVSICLEYVEDDAEKINIYASCENRAITGDYFYKINGQIWQRHHLNRIPGKNYDVSGERQGMCMRILLQDVQKIQAACKTYNQPMPTQFKLVYDVAKNSLDAHYEYENQYSYDPVKSSDDVADEWFEQIKAQEEGSAQ